MEHSVHYDGEKKEQFDTISKQLDEILNDMEVNDVLNILINYIANGIIEIYENPIESSESWALALIKATKIVLVDKNNNGTIQ